MWYGDDGLQQGHAVMSPLSWCNSMQGGILGRVSFRNRRRIINPFSTTSRLLQTKHVYDVHFGSTTAITRAAHTAFSGARHVLEFQSLHRDTIVLRSARAAVTTLNGVADAFAENAEDELYAAYVVAQLNYRWVVQCSFNPGWLRDCRVHRRLYVRTAGLEPATPLNSQRARGDAFYYCGLIQQLCPSKCTTSVRAFLSALRP